MPSLRTSAVHAICLALLSVTAAGTPRIPSRVNSLKPGFKFPIWVSAAEVFDSRGAVLPDAISPAVVEGWNAFDEARKERGTKHPHVQTERVASEAEMLAADCRAATVVGSGAHESPYVTLQDHVTSAKAIVTGTVREEEPGFYGGATGTLMRVEVERVLKSSASLDTNGDIYVFIAVGRFRAGGRSFCAGNPDDLAPAIGSHVVVFSFEEPQDPARKLLELDFSRDLAVAAADGTLTGPHAPETPDLRSLVSMIRELLPRAVQRAQ